MYDTSVKDDGQNLTRLAPSPTGALHLGNARTFAINWALARQRDWRILLRIEDLDGPRVKVGADQQAIDDLRWLGLDWDHQAPHQLADLTPYHEALKGLRDRDLTYACSCTRREIVGAQSAPHDDGHEMRYPGTCRGGVASTTISATRIRIPDEVISFVDEIHGPQSINVQQQIGDFIVATKAGLPSYQLAVVVDDARQGVTDVVRGDDLLTSTGRQLWLYRLLNLPAPRRWWHLPLVLGSDGRRLAKRHGDTRIGWYRDQGVSPQRILGLLAWWSGANERRDEMPASAFIERFDISQLPRQPITYTQEDHVWLLGGK